VTAGEPEQKDKYRFLEVENLKVYLDPKFKGNKIDILYSPKNEALYAKA